ncbi:MAG: twin-arginine translocase subunit TatC [Actinomycetes bacterium]|jgi:sec-independent protein translocase protein TatC|nr:twin-arginine translocase subunit TatC [Actinomycetes bacterium]
MPPIQAKKMPFFSHFAELRRRLTVCVAVLGVLSIAFFAEPVFKFLYNLLLSPVLAYLPDGKLITSGPFDPLVLRFQIGFFGALLVSSPVIIYEIFAFFAPALKERERKWVFPTVGAAIVLFAAGVCFFYFILYQPAFEWLFQQGAGVFRTLPNARDYLSGIGMLLIGFGISFELPLVVFYLIGMSIVPYWRLRESWRIAYVAVVVVAAIATPDWSPYNMLGLAAALLLLYEGSLAAARAVFSRKILQQQIDAYEDEHSWWETTDDDEELKRRERIRKRAEVARTKLSEDRDSNDA